MAAPKPKAKAPAAKKPAPPKPAKKTPAGSPKVNASTGFMMSGAYSKPMPMKPGMGTAKGRAPMTTRPGASGKVTAKPARPATAGSGGINLGKFAGEVAGNFGKGVDQVVRGARSAAGSVFPQGQTGGTVPSSQWQKNRDAINKAIGK